MRKIIDFIMNILQRIASTTGLKVNSAIPAQPIDFLASTVSSSQIDLAWVDDSYNETGFEIYHSTTSPTAGFTLLYTTTADEESYSHTGLTEGTTHYYKLRAINANGESDYVEASGTTIVPAPSNLDASTVSSTQINLTWDDNSSTETAFEIFQSTDGATFSLIHTTAANVESYNNTGLTANTTYYYRVRAVGAIIRSEPSNTDSATTSPALNAPSDLTATAVSSSQIDLEWTDNSSNETGFEIERSTSSGSGFSNITTTAADVTTYSDTGRTASTTYYYRIRAVNAEGSTAYTAEANATTTAAGTIPNAPTALLATGAGNTNITLSWNDNSSNETGFQIERSVDSPSAFSLLTTTAAGANTYNDTGLDEGRRYYYRVRATNGSGNSAYTNTVNEITTWSSPVTYIDKGTAAASSTSTLAVPYPAGISAGALIACVIGTKTNKTMVNTPTGWITGSAEGFIDYNPGAGGNQGSVTGHVFLKICTGSETGSQNFTIVNTPNTAYGVMYLLTKDSNAYWAYDISGGSHRTVNTTSYSVTSWEKIGTIKGDAILAVSLLNFVATANLSPAPALTQSGVSISTTNAEINDSSTTTGNRISQIASLFHVTGNTSTSQKMVYTMTLNTSTTLAPIGITIFIRLRNARTSPTYVPAMRTWRGADIVHTTNTAIDVLSIWDGQRMSYEGPDSYTTRYQLAPFNGRTCMKFVCDLTTGINRRTEMSQNWQPLYPIGTQIIEEWKMETDANQIKSVGEVIWYQNHPGSAAGYPENHPLIYLAWTYNGQTGFDVNPGTSTGGELQVVINVKQGTGSGNYIRNRYPSVTWGPNKVYRVRHHIRFDVVTGDPVYKIWVGVDGGAMTLLYETYTYPTVTSTDAELGVPAMVGGQSKLPIYHQMLDTETDRLANIAAGHTNYTVYIPCIKRITMLPSDSFYFTDYTNNSASIYDLVSTENE